MGREIKLITLWAIGDRTTRLAQFLTFFEIVLRCLTIIDFQARLLQKDIEETADNENKSATNQHSDNKPK